MLYMHHTHLTHRAYASRQSMSSCAHPSCHTLAPCLELCRVFSLVFGSCVDKRH